MRKVLIFAFTIILGLALCSCRKTNNDFSSAVSSVNSSFVHTTNSEYAEISSNIDNSAVSQIESSKTVSNDTISSKEEQIQANPQQSIPQNTEINSEDKQTEVSANNEVIDFVPNTIKKSPTADESETYIPLSCKVYYKNQKYACALGTSNGVSCSAVVIVNDNDEYVKCVALLENDEGILTVYNDRIYFLSYPSNDVRDPKLLNTLSVYSMNLSGKDKRKESEISIPFTSITGINFISNSKYWIFSVANSFDLTDDLYRYDVVSKEFKKLCSTNNKESVYIIGEQIFCVSSNRFYKADINYENKQLFFDASNLTNGFIFVEGTQNGFIIEIDQDSNKYFLDLSGNFAPM